MRISRDTDPILPTTNMATNGKSKDGKNKVLVVGAGAAGEFISWPGTIWYRACEDVDTGADELNRHVVRAPFVATS